MTTLKLIFPSSICLSLLLIGESASPENEPTLETQLQVFDEWQISQSVFCPEEPVVVRVSVTNSGSDPIELRLGTGEYERAYFRVTNASGQAVWDTDEIDRLEEEAHIRDHGMGRIFVGRGEFRHRILNPSDTAFWISQWTQKDLNGDFVPDGKYVITMDYRWIYTNAGRVVASTAPLEIEITNEGCD